MVKVQQKRYRHAESERAKQRKKGCRGEEYTHVASPTTVSATWESPSSSSVASISSSLSLYVSRRGIRMAHENRRVSLTVSVAKLMSSFGMYPTVL